MGTVVYLAEYRAQHASVRHEVKLLDPIAAWRFWWDVLAGVGK